MTINTEALKLPPPPQVAVRAILERLRIVAGNDCRPLGKEVVYTLHNKYFVKEGHAVLKAGAVATVVRGVHFVFCIFFIGSCGSCFFNVVPLGSACAYNERGATPL
jgi:hypothetical protein